MPQWSDTSQLISRQKKNIADAVNICGRTPGMNALRAADLMRRRPVATICADENRCVNFAAKILQQSRQQNDCARHIMRKLDQEQSRLTTINEHQLRKREVGREPNIMRVLPAADFIEEPRESMDVALEICLAFARPQ